MGNQLIIDGKPYSVIGGTSAYIQLSITVPVLVNGVKTNTPIEYSDAEIKAVAYSDNGVVESAAVEDLGNGLLLIRLSSDATQGMAKPIGTATATLDVSATLKYPMANTSYKAGDKLGYRWSFFVEAGMQA
ncbi:MAG: hypothetical protein V4536_08785 [Pseudomonadota bacterium]